MQPIDACSPHPVTHTLRHPTPPHPFPNNHATHRHTPTHITMFVIGTILVLCSQKFQQQLGTCNLELVLLHSACDCINTGGRDTRRSPQTCCRKWRSHTQHAVQPPLATQFVCAGSWRARYLRGNSHCMLVCKGHPPQPNSIAAGHAWRACRTGQDAGSEAWKLPRRACRTARAAERGRAPTT